MESSGGKQRHISKHEIFLSHSGTEKPFVEQLCHDLERANHHPFFDQDSDILSKSKNFNALKILEAAEQCQLGVVVLSEGYLTSVWPMLELNKFVESKKTGNPQLRLFPLFFMLSRSDLNESEVETKWKPRWRQLVEGGVLNEDLLELWTQAVKELQASDGLEFAKFADSEYNYRCAVVEEIYKLLPPANYKLQITNWDIEAALEDKSKVEFSESYDKIDKSYGQVAAGPPGFGGDETRMGRAATASSHKDHGYSEISRAVASSSGLSNTEEYAAEFTKKVQSKDLKSECLIGKGPSSIVYETTWIGTRYARKDFLRVPSDVFEKEAAALVGLDPHPNVVRTYYWAVNEGSCSLVLELMDDDLLNVMRSRKDSQRKKSQGSGLKHVIDDLSKLKEDGKKARIGTASSSVARPPVYPFDMPEALQIIQQIAQGMKFLHDNGVVHGDLKPKNILVQMSGRAASSSGDKYMTVKVVDFGLVETKKKSRSLVSRQARKMEMIRWRAPELWELRGLREDGHEPSMDSDSDWDSDSESNGTIGELIQSFPFVDMAMADVYSFGLTCSQILHGEDPFSGLGVNELVNKTILPGVRPDLPPTCPAELRALIESCWAQEKNERPSFEDIISKLKDLHTSFPRTGSPMTGPSSFGRIDSKLVPEIAGGYEKPNFKKIWKWIKKWAHQSGIVGYTRVSTGDT